MGISKQEPDVSLTVRYTLAEVCAMLGVSRTTMWRLRTSGALRFSRDKLMHRLTIPGLDVFKFWKSIRNVKPFNLNENGECSNDTRPVGNREVDVD